MLIDFNSLPWEGCVGCEVAGRGLYVLNFYSKLSPSTGKIVSVLFPLHFRKLAGIISFLLLFATFTFQTDLNENINAPGVMHPAFS
jgi:hypothetical protein